MRRADEEFEEDCLVPTFKQSTVRVMVWGCIMKGKKGPLTVMEYAGGKKGGINARIYQEQVLDPVLLPFWTQVESERGSVSFQHDGAPAHTDHSISRFPHPPSSLNPIEAIWHELKAGVRTLQDHPTMLESLIAAVHKV
ncbi:hypothetical protein D9757_001618 [Collybiopsis confluens]|uniref:Tc1-like transposase DDE domain-containing protein n=1 Tax=Collybiopsis confluens TaxID=2823264 RepID=A0A8H5HYQ1_9AGAR|nr:hypothetical protein D9757_001618 [Collybiopsis confluens]